MAAISLRGLTKRFGSVVAVNNLNLDLAEGGIMALLGPSGCGKTTTLRMLAGFETADEGRILLGAADVTTLPPERRNTGMVFQNYALFPHLNVFRNIAFGLEMRGTPKQEVRQRVEAIIEKVQLTGLGERYPRQLSGGQQQRTALARALVINPSVLLLDEPLANLDAKLREEMRFYIRALQQEFGITTVYVTHDQIEAMTLADRIVIMNQGEIQQVGTPDQIYSDPANTFVAAFIGSPPMNLIPGSASGGQFSAPGLTVPCPPALSGKVTLGVRPEDCKVGGDHLSGTVYGVEPTGDVTYLTVATGSQQIEVKAPRDYRAEIDIPIRLGFDLARLYFFDGETGARLRNAA